MIMMQTANIISNLKDAGCSDMLIEQFLNLLQIGTQKERLRLLNEHRCRLLDSIHKNQKKLDCLDYLIFEMKQQN